MGWHIKSFRELSKEELFNIIRTRIEVFVVEQECPFQEVDGLDKNAYHIYWEEQGEITAYARIIPPGEEFEEASFGRVLVKKESRGRGLGQTLMDKVMHYCTQELGYHSIRIDAQKYLEKFYHDLGFQTVSEEFLLDGIDHIEMLYPKTKNWN